MYLSTRGDKVIGDAWAIVKGMADDGGLFVPAAIPVLSLERMQKLNYYQLASSIIGEFLNDFSFSEIKEIIENSYRNRFNTSDIVCVNKVGNIFVLELFHGPTLAFKDIALSLLPYIFVMSKNKIQNKKKTVILTATSGDTGSAALSGFRGVDLTVPVVFYPKNGTSVIQEYQMLSYADSGAIVVALDGDFDAAQRLVKAIFADKSFQNQNFELSTANSINIGRILPQIVYYFYAYFELINIGAIKSGEKINFVVPTGNFGNIFAGYLAKRMGLPINRLICACNQNNVLYDFFKSGRYNRNRQLFKTISPSMDILVSSNLERLLYYASDEDSVIITNLMQSLHLNGWFKVTAEIYQNLVDFTAYYVSERETLDTISQVYSEFNYLIDPHTAVAYDAYVKHCNITQNYPKTVILATAHPFKFPTTVLKALGKESGDNEFENLYLLSKYTKKKIPKSIMDLEKYQSRKNVWLINAAKDNLKERLKECGLQ
ncbi:MAG: threonine synthase [Bacilli bacterium]|nr:threonine synthase [Bacilli bacterium]